MTNKFKRNENVSSCDRHLLTFDSFFFAVFPVSILSIYIFIFEEELISTMFVYDLYNVFDYSDSVGRYRPAQLAGLPRNLI